MQFNFLIQYFSIERNFLHECKRKQEMYLEFSYIVKKIKCLPIKIKRIRIFITPMHLYMNFIGVLKGKHFSRLDPRSSSLC